MLVGLINFYQLDHIFFNHGHILVCKSKSVNSLLDIFKFSLVSIRVSTQVEFFQIEKVNSM